MNNERNIEAPIKETRMKKNLIQEELTNSIKLQPLKESVEKGFEKVLKIDF